MLERFYSNEPIRAYKQYYEDSNGTYRPVIGYGEYRLGVWYDAQQRHATTPLVHEMSHCEEACMVENLMHHGFHAWKPTLEYPQWSFILQWLEVELAGFVVEHEYGYRATRQRIVRSLTEAEVATIQEAIKEKDREITRQNRAKLQELFHGHRITADEASRIFADLSREAILANSALTNFDKWRSVRFTDINAS